MNLDRTTLRSTCSSARYILLGLFGGYVGAHNFAAFRYRIALSQCIIFVATIISLITWTFPAIALLTVPGLFLWVSLEIWKVRTDGKGRWMPP